MSSPITYKIKEFHPDLIQPSKKTMNNFEQGGMKITIIGKPGTGKSSLLIYLLYCKSDIFPVAQVHSPTENDNGVFKQIFPELFIYDELNTDALEEVWKRQGYAKKFIDNPWCLLITDDCMEDEKAFKLPIFNKIYKNGRHKKFLYINTLQYAIDTPRKTRVCFDGTFILKENSISVRRTLWENFAGVIPDFGSFCQIMDQLVENYVGIYIDNSSKSNNIEDCVYWVKVMPIQTYLHKFKIGCDEYWMFGKERLDDKRDE